MLLLSGTHAETESCAPLVKVLFTDTRTAIYRMKHTQISLSLIGFSRQFSCM